MTKTTNNQQRRLIKTKPNKAKVNIGKMNISKARIKDYENKCYWTPGENKPNFKAEGTVKSRLHHIFEELHKIMK